MKENDEMKLYSIPSDFKVITGIGPAVEKRLHQAGIVRYDQLARMTPAELAEILSGMVGMNPASIAEKGWIEDAASLSQKLSDLKPEKSTLLNNNRQHYAVFTMELLLDKENNVRRTRVLHVQTQKEATWAGWDSSRLLDFVIDGAELQLEKASKVSVIQPIPQPVAAEIPPALQEMEKAQPTSLQGYFRVAIMNFSSPQGEDLKWLIPASQPFTVGLGLDLSELQLTGGDQLNYEASIFIHQRTNSSRRELVKDHGVLEFAKSTSIDINMQEVPIGEYQLEALVVLNAGDGAAWVHNTLFAMGERRIQVYL